MGNGKESASVVKIDSSLLKEVEAFIKKQENKYRFVNKKQFIDLAVDKYLKNFQKEVKNEKKN